MGAVRDLVESQGFPCVMAKGLAKSNSLVESVVNFKSDSVADKIKSLVRDYELNHVSDATTLFSLAVEFNNVPKELLKSFESFENYFWEIVGEFRNTAEEANTSSNPENQNFRLHVAGSSYFLILLHPMSPRLSRRSKVPAIVFNRHQQFEWLKLSGVFAGIRNRIRKLDSRLQGTPNLMLSDFGDSSEIYQYSGRDYSAVSACPFHKLKGWLKWKS